MRFDFRGLYRRFALIFLALYALTFAVYYTGALIAFDEKLYTLFDLIYIVYGILNTAVGMLVPAMSALILIPKLEDKGFLGALPTALYLSVPSLFHNLLYYYLYYIAAHYDSLESILLSLLYSVFLILISAALSLGVSALALYVIKRKGSDSYDFTVKSQFYKTDTPSALSVFIICSVSLVLSLVLEITDTVRYLIEYAGRYRIDEIIYITGRYVILLGVFVLSLWLLNFIKYKILSKRFTEVYDDANNATD